MTSAGLHCKKILAPPIGKTQSGGHNPGSLLFKKKKKQESMASVTQTCKVMRFQFKLLSEHYTQQREYSERAPFSPHSRASLPSADGSDALGRMPSTFFLPYLSLEVKLLGLGSIFLWLPGGVSMGSVTWKLFASLHLVKNTCFNQTLSWQSTCGKLLKLLNNHLSFIVSKYFKVLELENCEACDHHPEFSQLTQFLDSSKSKRISDIYSVTHLKNAECTGHQVTRFRLSFSQIVQKLHESIFFFIDFY